MLDARTGIKARVFDSPAHMAHHSMSKCDRGPWRAVSKVILRPVIMSENMSWLPRLTLSVRERRCPSSAGRHRDSSHDNYTGSSIKPDVPWSKHTCRAAVFALKSIRLPQTCFQRWKLPAIKAPRCLLYIFQCFPSKIPASLAHLSFPTESTAVGKLLGLCMNK